MYFCAIMLKDSRANNLQIVDQAMGVKWQGFYSSSPFTYSQLNYSVKYQIQIMYFVKVHWAFVSSLACFKLLFAVGCSDQLGKW